MLSHIWFFVTPWTVACQAPVSMEFFRQEYWSGLLCTPPHYGIWIKLLILFEPKLQRAVNYTWKIVWAYPLADGKTVVANEVSRLPLGNSFYAFPPWCFESLHGESMPGPSSGGFSIMNKTTIKKKKKHQKTKNNNFFLFCRLKRQISFSKRSLLVSILGGLGWSRYKRSNSG